MNRKHIFVFIIAILLVIVNIIAIDKLIKEQEKVEEPIIEEPSIPLTRLMTMTYDQLKQEGYLDEIEIVDDRISPLTDQVVSLEILRIRKKGIEEQMRDWRPFAWKEKPSYYFEAILHDGVWTSHEINTWDTGYVGWEAFRKVDDDLKVCTITFSIYEHQKRLFGTTPVEKEQFSVLYCFRTGRWTGDRRLEGGLVGTGYLNGDHFEVWFDIHQSDYDGDGIPYWTEVNLLGTDPTVDDRYQDHDDDGIPTAWEWKWGFDPFTYDDHENIDISNDGLSNIDTYNLAQWGANPYRKDIYVEVDFMEKGPGFFTRDHVLWEESKQMVMDKFAKQDITLHVDDGNMGGGGEFLPFHKDYIAYEGGIASEYYKYHFSDERKGVFRYMIVVHSGGWCHPQDYKVRYDVMTIPDNMRFYLTSFFPPALTPRQQRIAMACAFMHELGHSLGLVPTVNPGIDNATQVGRGMEDVPLIQRLQKQREARRYWENYESVMNYDKFSQFVLGYSDGTHGKNDVDDWSMIDFTYFQRHVRGDTQGIRNKI